MRSENLGFRSKPVMFATAFKLKKIFERYEKSMTQQICVLLSINNQFQTIVNLPLRSDDGISSSPTYRGTIFFASST